MEQTTPAKRWVGASNDSTLRARILPSLWGNRYYFVIQNSASLGHMAHLFLSYDPSENTELHEHMHVILFSSQTFFSPLPKF